MEEHGRDKNPDESNFLETIEDSSGDSGTTQTPKDKQSGEEPDASGVNTNTQGKIATATTDISSIVETLETSNGAPVEVESTLEERKKKDQIDTEKTQSTPSGEVSCEPKPDLKKDGWNTEDPSLQTLKTIDPQNAFPDPPIYDPDSLQTTDGSNPPNAQAEDPIINSPEFNSLDTTVEKKNSENHLQNYSSLHGISSAEHKLDGSNSRRQSKDSLPPSNLSVNSIRNRQSSRSSAILKPKSSLREPEYKHQREEFLDSNMLISNAKLDGLLFRLFSLPGRLNGNDEKQLPFVDDGKSDIISMDPVIWNLRPMTAVQKETLDSEMEFLEDTLMPKQVVRQLFMDGILTHMDYNQIMRTEGQGEKAVVRLFVGTLKRRGEKAFPQFMKALKDLHHSRIWERLDATERSLSESLADDQRRSERRFEMERLTTRSILKTRFKEDENSEDILRQFLRSNLEDTPPMTLAGSKAVEEARHGSEDQQGHGSSPKSSSERLQSRQLEQQLTDINTELKALHEGLNLLQSARSSTGGIPQSSQESPNTTRPIQSVDTEYPNPQTLSREARDALPTEDTKLPNMVNDSSARNNHVQQKSGTCVIF